MSQKTRLRAVVHRVRAVLIHQGVAVPAEIEADLVPAVLELVRQVDTAARVLSEVKWELDMALERARQAEADLAEARTNGSAPTSLRAALVAMLNAEPHQLPVDGSSTTSRPEEVHL